MSFGEQLTAARKRLDLSQAEAAAYLEVGKRTLEHWEADDRIPLKVTQEGVLQRLKNYRAPRKGSA